MVRLLTLLATCGPGPEAPPAVPPPPPPVLAADAAPDLVLVLAAGLRADPPGEPAAEAAFLAPFLDEPALVASAAYAQSTEPFMSLGSLLTGRYPSAVPLCGSTRADPGSTRAEAWCHALPSGVPTLPGVLALYGYRSALLHHLGPISGLDEAFGVALALDAQGGKARWDEVDAAVRAWWAAAPGPRLLVLELPDLDLAGRDDVADELGLPEPPERGRPTPDLDQPPPRRPPCSPLQGIEGQEDGTWDALAGQVPDLDAARARAQGAYRAEAAALGERVHTLLADLPRDRPRTVVLAGQYGLSIGEAGGTDPGIEEFFWSDRLADRTLRVPLAIVGSGAEGILDQPVELLDLMPTLLALGGAVPPHGLPGQDLLASDLAEDPAAVAYAERGDMLALRQGERLLTLRAVVHHMPSLDPYLTEILACPGLVGGVRMHDVRADPWQEVDLVRAHPDEALALKAALLAVRTGPGAPPPALYEGERLLQLRLTQAEGYW
jgi:arylsulfatase A-like enzyme